VMLYLVSFSFRSLDIETHGRRSCGRMLARIVSIEVGALVLSAS
jgi:hypothetical protein